MAVIECGVFIASFFGVQSLLLDPDRAGMLSELWRLAFVCILMLSMMFAVGLYNWSGITNNLDLLVRLVTSLGLAYIAYGALVYPFTDLRLPASALTLALALSAILIFLLRIFFMRITHMNQLKTRILLLGVGPQAARIEKLEKQGAASRFVIDAFVDIENGDRKVDESRIQPLPQDLAAYCEDRMIGEIVLAMQERRGQLPLGPLIKARLHGVTVTEYQAFMERAEGRIDLDALRPSWFLQSEGFRTSRLHLAAKRLFDLVLSASVLLFTLPVLIVTAIAIRLESPGPVFYKQERMGLGGRPFVLIKFRSMREDAEKGNAPQWAAESDPRVTRVGAFIRKTRIDEIPQIINVLKGDMSFVGPRPERPYFVDMLSQKIPFYHERHSVRPGITGWAQLNYPYGASEEDARQKLQYDLFYIKYFSIVFELAIVLQTIRVVIWPDGAR